MDKTQSFQDKLPHLVLNKAVGRPRYSLSGGKVMSVWGIRPSQSEISCTISCLVSLVFEKHLEFNLDFYYTIGGNGGRE